MKTAVFELQSKQNIWICENIQIQQIEKHEWTVTIDHERQVYESIYDVINELAGRDFHALFRLPEEMENFHSMDKCL